MDARKWYSLKKISHSYTLDPSSDEATSTRVCRKTASRSRLTRLAFDNGGERLLVIDSEGVLTLIELEECMRYCKLGKVRSCSFLGFNPTNKNELLVGSLDGSIKILKTNGDAEAEFCSLIGHKFPVKYFSSYKNCTLTSSSKEVIIWDLTTCSKLHQLRFSSGEIVVQKASFSATGTVAALYGDGSLQVWRMNNLEKNSDVDPKSLGLRDVRDYRFTRDGRAIVLAGIPNLILVLNTFKWDLIKRLELPDRLTSVKELAFLPQPLDGGANKILAVLSSDKTLRFLDLSSSQFVSLFSSSSSSSEKNITGVNSFAISPSGRHLAYVDITGSLRLEVTDTLLRLEPKENEKRKTKVDSRSQSRSHGAEDHLRCVRRYMREELGLKRLVPILKEFGEYPKKHRAVIWTSIMELPRNRSAYAALSNKIPRRRSMEKILCEYPLTDRGRASFLAAIVNSLIHWCPLLSQSDFLPRLIFPFLVVFQGNHVLAFETIIFLLLNYCQRWFEYHPLPPLNVLAVLENVLSEADPQLLNHFCRRGITSSEYIWPLLQTVMSEVLSGDEWLVFWDHLLSSGRPSLLLTSSIAYSICSREIITSQLHSADDFSRFYRAQGHLRAVDLLRVARRLDNEIPYHLHPARYFRNATIALPKTGPYPSFLDEQYPKFLTEDSHLELQRLQQREERATILRNNELRELKSIEEKRLRIERENFLREIDAARINEMRRCYQAKIFTDEFTSKKIHSRKVSLKHRTRDTKKNSRNVDTTEESFDEEWRPKDCKKLQDQVKKLEFEVQTLLETKDSTAKTKVAVCK